MNKTATMFPAQKLPLKKKNKEWSEACVNYIIGSGETMPTGKDKTRFEEMQTYYDLYNSVFNADDLRYVTDPFEQEDGFPASLQNFNIIKPKIDLLMGEETKHPFNFKVVRTSQDSSSDAQDKMKQMLLDYVMSSAMALMDPTAAEDFQSRLDSGEVAPPEKIQKFISKDYKDIAESAAHHTLNYLKEKLNLEHQFNKGWKDALIAGEEVYYTGIMNGEPHQERVNPMFFAHDVSPDLEFIEDGDWACRRMRMSYTEAYDRLFDKMDEKTLDKLLDLVEQKPQSGNYGKDMPIMDYTHLDMNVVSTNGNDDISAFNQVNVWHVTWKSYKKIGFVTIEDEMGEMQQIVVSEDYLKIGNETSIEWKWVIEVWEGYRIGEDIFVAISPLQYQHVSADNLNAQKLPYSGVVYNNTNSIPKSLVAIMKPLQYMYIIVWYRLELALARDKGKVINMDITQIPKSMNIDASKWMHYLTSIGVNFINPYEEGWNIPGREGGKPAQFNQMSALDLTMSNVIAQYIQLLTKIETMLDEVSGVSPQREGAVSASELVGNVNSAVNNSANITAPLFYLHNQCKKNALRMLLNTAKEAWRDSGKTSLQYIMQDDTRAFLKLSDAFFYEDYDLFVSNSTQDLQNLEAIRSLYQPAMQNGASLLDVTEIMTMDNISAIKTKLKDLESKKQAAEQQNAESENQRQMQLVQTQNEYKQQEIVMKQQELDLAKYKIDSDNQTKVVVAEMNAYRGQENLDADGNGIPDVMEIADMSLRQSEHEASIMDKQMQNDQKVRESILKHNVEKQKIDSQRKIEEGKATLERDKLKFEEKKLEAEKSLQKQKDIAAMDREKL